MNQARKRGVWTRVGFALVSVFVGIAGGAFLNDVVSTVGFARGPFSGIFEFYLFFFFCTAVYGSVGWVLWLLLIVGFAEVRGRRSWALLALGTILGPVSLMVVTGLTEHHVIGLTDRHFAFDPIGFMIYSFAIIDATVTTLVYLLLFTSLRANAGRKDA